MVDGVSLPLRHGGRGRCVRSWPITDPTRGRREAVSVYRRRPAVKRRPPVCRRIAAEKSAVVLVDII